MLLLTVGLVHMWTALGVTSNGEGGNEVCRVGVGGDQLCRVRQGDVIRCRGQGFGCGCGCGHVLWLP